MENLATTKGEKREPLKRIPRIQSIDFLRAIAILIMISGHFGLWFLNGDELSWSWWDWYGMWFGPIGAPIFLICVGFSLVFYVENKKVKFSEKEIRNAIFRRGFFIWGVGYIINLLTEPISRLWIWNIIVLIGVSTIIAYFLLKLTIPQRVIITCILLILNPLSQLIGILTYHNIWGIWVWDPFLLHDILGHTIEIHDIWNPFSLNMVLIGTIIGTTTRNKIKEGEMSSIPKIYIIYGVLICIFAALIDPNLRLPGVMSLIQEFEHEIHIIFSTGVFLSFFGLFFWFQDIKMRNLPIMREITYLSPLSFTIYVAHLLFAKYFVGPILSSTIGAFTLNKFVSDPFIKTIVYFFIFKSGNLIATYSLQIITFSFTFFMWIISIFWMRFKMKYSLEWVIRKLS
ncbi:MAG: heparan-alpha-glucosaminide N-acetyltransferase domain-containing protein [Candidatus Hodarchaeota archaeon]